MSDALIESVKKHEGLRTTSYQDTEGVWTIGYGTNLQTLTISERLAETWLLRDLQHFESVLKQNKVFCGLDRVRQEVLIEMAYNLGHRGLMGFKKMWAALEEGNFIRASEEGLDSKWAKQVKGRAVTLMTRMRYGQ